MDAAESLEIIEKTMCAKCGIIFERADTCPRCGKSDALSVYFEVESKDLFPVSNII